MHTVFALLCFVVVIHWLIFPYPSGLLHWHCGNLTIAPVPAKQPWWIWINTSCEFIMNDCITTTKQSTTKPCAYFLGYTVQHVQWHCHDYSLFLKVNSIKNIGCRTKYMRHCYVIHRIKHTQHYCLKHRYNLCEFATSPLHYLDVMKNFVYTNGNDYETTLIEETFLQSRAVH